MYTWKYPKLFKFFSFLKPLEGNSRCCCNNTPSTAGQNQNYFYQTSSKSCFKKKLSCNRPIPPGHLTQSSWHSICLYACYKCTRFILHTLVRNAYVADRKTPNYTIMTWESYSLLDPCWFQYSVGKKYQDFILSLMAFPYSNICYCCPVKYTISFPNFPCTFGF